MSFVSFSFMYWIGLVLILLRIQSINGECTALRGGDSNYYKTADPYILDCDSIDQEQFLDFIDDHGFPYYAVNLRNSSVSLNDIISSNLKAKIKKLFLTHSTIQTLISSEENYREYVHLDLSFNRIKEMNFLKDFKRLYFIGLHHNRIEFLNGSDLAKNDNLKFLDLSYNDIKNFSEVENGGLSWLNLSHNSIEEIGSLLTNLHRIQIVDLSYNKLKDIFAGDFGKLTHLRHLYLQHNDIISFQYNAIDRHWRWSGFVNLAFNYVTTYEFNDRESDIDVTSLNFTNNGFTDLNFLMSQNGRRIIGYYLIFRDNKIKTLYPFNFKGLRFVKLDLSFNEIELIPPFTFHGFHLKELYLEHNKITWLNPLSFSGLSDLHRLNLSFNPLTTIDLAFKDLRLESFDLSHCLLIKVPRELSKLKSVSEIYLNHNNIESIEPESFPSLAVLDLSYNKIKKLDANVFSGLNISKSLNLSYNNLESLKNVFINSKIHNVILTGMSLSKLSKKDVEGLNDLEYLNLGNVGIEELTNNTFDRLSSLKTLSLDDNSIRTIPSNFFGLNDELKSLSITRNPISMISPDSFPRIMKLKYLYLTINGEIKEKRFYNLIFLEEFHIVHSFVKEINKDSFRGLRRLTKLNFENSTVLKVEPGAFLGLRNVVDFDARNLFAKISNLKPNTFVGLKTLRSLDLSKIGIDSIEDDAFFGLERLTALNLDHNEIGNLSRNAFAGLKKLERLDLSYNVITGEQSTFPTGIFNDLVHLTNLYLQHNSIEKLDIGTFTNLRNLRFLNLSHNLLTRFDELLLFPLKNIQFLDVNSNGLEELYYNHFNGTSANHVGIGGNRWPCDKLGSMLRYFDKYRVDYLEMSELHPYHENVGGIYCESSFFIF